ncbi:MAG TPA: tetratricopeptide repeat protein [Candidatus Binatia bacterium]|nr:tetratricopeptide repeat protein [Candidatus Binatia bacterium]
MSARASGFGLATGCVLVVALHLCAPGRPAEAETDLRARARQIASEINAQQAGGRFDARAQQSAIQQLGQLALSYIDQTDRAVRAGTDTRDKDALLSTYEAISEPLERVYDKNRNQLEQSAKSVMDQDGDLEALYDTPQWKESQMLASQALYYLNWLHYYGARLYSGDKRKELLEKGERGFSEFAVGDRKNELITESLLGRGLCHLELGNYDWAVRDFQIVSEDRDTSAERRAKAKLGMLDASARAGKVQEVVRLSDAMLASGESADASLIRYYRVRALLEAAKKSSGAEAARYRQQAMATMDQLRRAGPGWQEKMDALLASEAGNVEQFSADANSPAAKWTVAKLLMQKSDYKGARPLLEAIIAGTDADSKRIQPEAHYYLGLALFQAGDYQGAATHFTASLAKGEPSWGADAAYLRFKALEALAAKSPDVDPKSYEDAMRSYLAQYPDHKSVYEARYRLGEWLQARKQFSPALAEYERVSGDPGFELRARFGALQCRFEILQGNDEKKVAGAERDAVIKAIGADLDQFNRLAADCERRGDQGGVPLKELRAKAAVMNAVYATVSPEPRDEQALAGLVDFEKKYPNQSDLFAQVVRLRLGAMQRLGQFTDAEAEVRKSAAVLRADGHPELIEQLATGFVKEGTRRKSKGDAQAWPAAQQVASRLYELLLAESEGNNKAKLTLARLYEGSDELEKADALYGEILSADGNSLAALRGRARIAEAQKNLPGALGYWQQFAKVVRPGDLPWYESSYEIARLTFATGKKDKCCDQLDQLKPAMPGLTDADLRTKLDELYKRACK